MSVESLVLTKSKGKTTETVQPPASPPESIEANKNFALFCSGLLTLMNFPNRSLSASENAFIGKTFMTFAPFPFQRFRTPSSLTTLETSFVMPADLCFKAFGVVVAVCWMSLILSNGATEVLAMQPDRPPRTKLTRKLSCLAALELIGVGLAPG